MTITKRAKAYIRNSLLARERSLENRRLQALGLCPTKHAASTSASTSSSMGKRGHPESSDEEDANASHLKDAVEIVSCRQTVDARGRPTASFKIRWAPTWETYEQMEDSVPQLVKEYERQKPNKIVNVLGPQLSGLQEEITESPFVVERANGKKAVVDYALLRKEYPDALIDYFLSKMVVCDEREKSPLLINLDDDDSVLDDVREEAEEESSDEEAVRGTLAHLLDSLCV
ncbi:hypothetical protein QR680_005880 [Steinernema hermaphroditum]|uniref:Chromo shadow domain-containing protein n=1 Tax=Steinernema hermaphroditum TaxID=289476 RepID=A0AA39HUZ2_9BILA|nr:hypothetical protein QR680_005880 [Steinernema hermaphroditum]